MSEQRPNPEKLLQQVQEEERQAERGKLKIYLGAAPGVGKTYMMLRDAIVLRSTGLDVIIGVVESHGREEIIKLLEPLEELPLQEVHYRDRSIGEFNLDAALKRAPGLILMDEMAHTNAPGLRHTKRWQDIKEILDRGIDVYTTLNVQHIESLNDIVSQIIHTPIKETVPDSMLDLANSIELVDLPPEDLIKRLQDGKVYFPKQAELAAEHFFRKGNLTALRELALRVTAERVGAQVLEYRKDQGIKHVWPTKEKILVCVGAGSQSTKLIRAARRMATSLQAEWIAIHVNAPHLQLTDLQHNSATKNMRLAEQLGAHTVFLSGLSVVQKIMNFAREQNITKIIVGKTPHSRWRDLLFSSLADELVRNSGEIDVYIITSQTKSTTKISLISSPEQKTSWGLYIFSLTIMALATFIDYIIRPYSHYQNPIMIYVLAVTIISLFGKLGPTILATTLSLLAYLFILYLMPEFNHPTSNAVHFLTFLILFLIVLIVVQLSTLIRRQALSSNVAERRAATLHTLSRQLASTRGTDKLLNTTVQYISDVFDSEVIALLPNEGYLEIRSHYKAKESLNEKEQGVAQWVYDLGQIAGLGTDTLPFSDAIYLPLMTSQGPLGVIRVRPIKQHLLFTPEQIHLLESCANQAALAIEVDRLQEKSRHSEIKPNQMSSTLLQSMSHDLRTPLISVMGSASTLIEMSNDLEPSAIKKLGNTIYSEAEQENYLINNLLQITYLESDDIKLKKQKGSLLDELNFTLKTLEKRLDHKPVKLHYPADLPLIPFDKALIHSALICLIDNAIKYTTPESPLDLTVKQEKREIIISIEDRGPGIVPDEMNQLYEKFYRGRLLATKRGLGLGLSIAKHIINAHQGKIWAENRTGGGASFHFTLPLNN